MNVTGAAPTHVLQSIFGYEAFRPYQEPVVQRLVGGGDALVLMPTGGGKSLCYQIPAMIRDGTGIVISPLISLMQDQVDALQQVGVKAAVLNSSLGPREREAVEHRLTAGALDLCYVAPERATAIASRICCPALARPSSPSTRHTASRSGDTTSAPSTWHWRSSGQILRTFPASLSPQRPIRPRRTSSSTGSA